MQQGVAVCVLFAAFARQHSSWIEIALEHRGDALRLRNLVKARFHRAQKHAHLGMLLIHCAALGIQLFEQIKIHGHKAQKKAKHEQHEHEHQHPRKYALAHYNFCKAPSQGGMMTPRLVYADQDGRVRDHPRLLMACNRNGRPGLPEAGELIPLPAESELFLLPGRTPLGINPKNGNAEAHTGLAVAAFAAPGYTLSAHPAYSQAADAPLLPLFAYGAVGYCRGRFWLCASRVDDDPRQKFAGIPRTRIEAGCRQLLAAWPQNRLVSHIINNCVRKYDCPAARNFALGRHEAPLPTSRACNARCLGCISLQAPDAPVAVTPQCRIAFTPTAAEIAQVMAIHASREQKQPIYSFGQGCEGDPLANWQLLCDAIALFRADNGHGTVNCNTNGSKPQAIQALAASGLTSARVSLNSARPKLYHKYYRPLDYEFADVKAFLAEARRLGIFTSLNLLYFPGISDTAAELAALAALCRECGVSMIQLRNLNIDPVWYATSMGAERNQALGLRKFMAELQKSCPWLKFGYFNPWLGDKANIAAPMPGQ